MVLLIYILELKVVLTRTLAFQTLVLCEVFRCWNSWLSFGFVIILWSILLKSAPFFKCVALLVHVDSCIKDRRVYASNATDYMDVAYSMFKTCCCSLFFEICWYTLELKGIRLCILLMLMYIMCGVYSSPQVLSSCLYSI